MPALPLGEAGKYVAAAYIVFFAMTLIYVGIMALRLQGIRERIRKLAEFEQKESGDSR